MSSQRNALLAASLVLCALVAMPAAVRAQAGQRELFITPSLHYLGAPAFGPDAGGPGAGLALFYGVTPQLSLGVSGLYTQARASSDGRVDGPAGAVFAAVGYNFDVLVVIPFITAGVGVAAGDGLWAPDHARPAARVALGADWRPRRNWALGVQLDNLWRLGGPSGTSPALGLSVRFSQIVEIGGL